MAKTKAEVKERKKATTVADLTPLEGEALKQFEAIQKAGVAFALAISEASEVPPKHLRVLRRDVNSRIRRGTLSTRKARLQERIAKLQQRFEKLED